MALADMLTPRLVELGSIKIGTVGEERRSKSGGTYRMPKKLDHFIVTTKFRENGVLRPDQTVMESLQRYADVDGHIRDIPIAVLSDDIEDFLRSRWVSYSGKKCLASSDGVTLTAFYDRKTMTPLPEPATHPWNPEWAKSTDDRGAPVFKKHTTLDCVIATPEARWGGVYRFRTTSVITGDQLYGSLLHVKALTGGILRGMPLRLCVRPREVSPEGKPTTVYCVYVDLMGADLVQLQNRALEIAEFQRKHRSQLLMVQRDLRQLMSDPGYGEDEDTQADVQQEFHPEPEEAPSLDDLTEPEAPAESEVADGTRVSG